MNAAGAVSDQEGYALVDALVGIAITGIVLLFSVGAMREISSVRKRLEADAQRRLELTSSIQAIRTHLDRAYPVTRSKPDGVSAETSSFEYSFIGSYPAEGVRNSSATMRFRNEIGRNGKQGLSLEISRPDFGSRSAALIGETANLQFSSRVQAGPFFARELVISFAQNPQSESVSLHFSQPRFARTICIAAPFDPSCRP